ncbi:PREDICTED: probable isoprenylcysteine alpha-carbonyl methylesterase ICMEL1 [Brassica oleracea var. oleracea]|uniref:protein-S-isoprenylcysteine alpha-carbonyl methylesterase n=1 Tax=Brassica oleracea var. oleracea TaxID=109376 RepID=A0A0D3CD56_BRAOL|nr:PREDICTED: probable isoprenylcysteine alpha-carbonyl methylesterase ICMEL1 [Brassica oleracea var. oleracea]
MPSQTLFPISSSLLLPPKSSTEMMFKPLIYDDPSSTTLLLHDDHSVKPLLSRASSFNGAVTPNGESTGLHQNRRRRSNSDNCLSAASPDGTNGNGQHTIGQEVSHAAAETFLLTRLFLKLLSYLGVGYRWITRFLALGCYAFLLMPGFIQVGYYYFFSPHVRRSIVYGDQPRNRLDLYLPKNSNGGPKPVVAFVTGGAWIIGYKAWGSLLGQQLSERDIIVACIDYRNFPQGSISDMVKDASSGISFICNHIAVYGGDPDRIYLMGQSAGAHIAACALVDQVVKESGEGDSVSWSSSQINAYFGLSGGYNLLSLVDHFHSRGLYRSIFLSIMEGEESLKQFSPELVVQDPNLKHIVARLPPIILFHGTADYSIPSDASKCFAETLQRLGGKAEVILYEGKTHTDLFLQDPMRGGKDEMFEDIVSVVMGDNQEVVGKSVDRRRLVPEFMLKLAHWVSPF